MNNYKLSFSTSGNAKLDKTIAVLSLPSGFTCPGAAECLAKADRDTGKITDGPLAKYRCFAASAEAAFSSVRKQRWYNHLLLFEAKTKDNMAELIERSLPKNEVIRIHVGGDFFSQTYFDAWLKVIKNHPEKRFYAYTKSLKFWVARLLDIPPNFNLTGSRGGRFDHLIDEHGLRCVRVFFHPEEAAAMGLEIDHDDKHAIFGVDDFGLLLHGQGKKDSPHAAALARMRDEKIEYAYSK